MKYLRRYLSLLVCLALSLTVFSVNANAAENDKTITRTYTSSFYGKSLNLFTRPNPKTAGNMRFDDTEKSQIGGSADVTTNDDLFIKFRLTYANDSGLTLFTSDRKVKLTTENFVLTYGIMDSNLNDLYYHEPDRVRFYLQYVDGSLSSYFDGELTYNSSKQKNVLVMEFTPDKEVTSIVVDIDFDFRNQSNISTLTDYYVVSAYIKEAADYQYSYTSVQSSEEAGLLGGLLEWIKNLWGTCESGFANIVKGITELPQKLWSLIEEGIKNLFVPDDQYMVSYQDKWEQLLSDRLGAVYEVANIVTDSWDSVMNADETNTISVPTVSIPLGETIFSFGGYDVKIVPDGFDVLVTALKLIIGIVATFGFINGLLKRYDEVMGVES